MNTNVDLLNFNLYYERSLKIIAKKIDQVEEALTQAGKDISPTKDLEKKADGLLGTQSELQKLYTIKRNELKTQGS